MGKSREPQIILKTDHQARLRTRLRANRIEALPGGRAGCWIKVKNPAAPAVTREAEEDWNSVPRRFPPATPTVTRPPTST
jgi:hypothetical protein